MTEPIHKVSLRNGRVRYRLIVDIGVDETGRRRQQSRTFDTKKQARDELSRIRNEISTGTYVAPSSQTLDEYLDEYLVGATRECRRSTRTCYRNALRCPREKLGHRTIQSITKADIERLVDYMLTAGRKRGGPAGTGLGPRSVRLTVGRLSAAFAMAVREGKLARNPVDLVTPPRYRPSERTIWNPEQVRTFLTHARGHRLHAAWRLSLYGLRRGEVLGLRWSDVDLPGNRLTVNQARVVVDGQIGIEEPKSRHGKRTLPLDDSLVETLKALRKQHLEDQAHAGPAYRSGLDDLDWHTPGDAYLAVDELGHPIHPDWYTDEFGRLLKTAGLPKIRLHDSRHTTFSLMEKAGVPISIISKWAGHHDSAFTMRTYVHANNDDLHQGAETLAQLHSVA